MERGASLMKKGFVIGLLAGFMVAGASLVLANSQIQAILNHQISITLDGKMQVMRDETTNEIQYPITYHDRTYLPLRTIANLLGVKVDYDAESNTAILKTTNENANQGEDVKENQEPKMKNDFELLKHMTKEKNYMISPFSLKMAMMLAANGAEGNTQSEILKVFGVNDIKEYNAYAKNIIQKYNSNEKVKLNIANSIWLNNSIAGRNINFAKGYQDLISEYYVGTAQSEDENNIAKKANQWIDEKTNGKIKNVLDEHQKADFLALLINTIYFKGKWANQFNDYATHQEVFTDRNSKKTEIDFMHQTRKYDYYEDENMKMVRIPYEDYETAMYVVLPSNEEAMDIEKAMDNMSTVKVELAIPKFKTEYSLSFSKILQQLGIKEAFDESNAKFKNVMFDGVGLNKNVYIGDVLQKTFIEVDENGTEAAAATAITMNATSALPQPEIIKEFKADRPFIYFIMDETNHEVLFMGEQAFAE